VPASHTNSNGSYVTGAPAAGLTNAQCWARYGVAIAGAVAPSTATSRADIAGLVNPI
jgi:hypothetical protein